MQLDTRTAPPPARTPVDPASAPAPHHRVVPYDWHPVVTAGDLLATRGPVVVPPDWWSWEGAHGGLVVALAAADALATAPEGAVLRSATAQLLRPVGGPLELRSTLVRGGRRVTTVRTEGVVAGRPAIVVHSTFGVAGQAQGGSDPLPAPAVAPPEELHALDLPPTIVPFGQHVEIRPADDVLPFAGGPTARLTAWVRLRDEHGAPGALRTIVLADALAPSLLATLRRSVAVPTVELAVHHRAPVAAGTDPWLLVRARTDWSDEGWVSEAVDLWDRAGTHVATARQLRLVA